MNVRGLLGGGVLLLGTGVWGVILPVNAQQQQLTALPAESGKLRFNLSADQAQLMVQVLGAVGCPTVAQMVTCQKAKELLESIQTQAREQSGN